MAFLLICAAWIFVAGYTSINAIVKAELFPTNVRALGVGLPYAITVSLFGGTAPAIALYFKSLGHEVLVNERTLLDRTSHSLLTLRPAATNDELVGRFVLSRLVTLGWHAPRRAGMPAT